MTNKMVARVFNVVDLDVRPPQEDMGSATDAWVTISSCRIVQKDYRAHFPKRTQNRHLALLRFSYRFLTDRDNLCISFRPSQSILS